METNTPEAVTTTAQVDSMDTGAVLNQAPLEDVVFEMLPINVEPGQTHTLTEYDKRMKRAARFGIDPTSVAGPQAQAANATTDD